MQQPAATHENASPDASPAGETTPGTAVGRVLNSTLNRGLNVRHIRFMALGSAIGTGLFYGSASAIQKAGPAVLLAYIIGGAAVFMVMRALGEMAVRHPVSGSFGQYASRYLGPLAGFVTGWTYVFEMAIVAIADVTAFSIYMGFWFPEVDRWIWILAIIFFLGALNLLSVKVFGELEFWFSLIKVVAIIAMIAGGAAIITFGFQAGGSTVAPGLGNLVEHGGFFPFGFEGLLASFAVVMFAFGGIETLGITAGEAADPKKVIPQGRQHGSGPRPAVLRPDPGRPDEPVPVERDRHERQPVRADLRRPWHSGGTAHPQRRGDHRSPLRHQQRHFRRRPDPLRAVRPGPCAGSVRQGFPARSPWMTVVMMAGILLVGVVLNAVIPEDVFLLIASIATFATVWVWVMILASHVAMKREIARKGLPASEFPSPWWPAASLLTIAFMALVIAVLGVFEDTRVALYVGARGWGCWSSPTASGSRGTDDAGRNLWTRPHRCRWFEPAVSPAVRRRPWRRPGLSSGMVPFTNLLAFALASLVLIAIPGPSVLFVIGRSLALGRKGGLLSVLGNALGMVPQIVAVAMGVGIVVAQSMVLFTIIKFAGAAYLAYLGIQAIRHRGRTTTAGPGAAVVHLAHAARGLPGGGHKPQVGRVLRGGTAAVR